MTRPTHSTPHSLYTTSRGAPQSDKESGDAMQGNSTHAEPGADLKSDPNDSWWNSSTPDTRAADLAVENVASPATRDGSSHVNETTQNTDISRSVFGVIASSDESTKNTIEQRVFPGNHREGREQESGSSYSPSQGQSDSSENAPKTKLLNNGPESKQEEDDNNFARPSTTPYKDVKDAIDYEDASTPPLEEKSAFLDKRFQALRQRQNETQHSEKVAPASDELGARQTSSSKLTQRSEPRNAHSTSVSPLVQDRPTRFSKEVTQLLVASQYSRSPETASTPVPTSMMSLTDTWPRHAQASPTDEGYHEISRRHAASSEAQFVCDKCGEIQPAGQGRLASVDHPTCLTCHSATVQKQNLTKSRKASSTSTKRKEPQFIKHKSILKSMRNSPSIPTPVSKNGTTQPVVRFAGEEMQEIINPRAIKSIEVVEALPVASEDLPGDGSSDFIKLGVKTMPGQSPIWIGVSRDAPLGELFVAALQSDDALRGYVFMLPGQFVRWDDTAEELDLKDGTSFEMHELPETWLPGAGSVADATTVSIILEANHSPAKREMLDNNKRLVPNHTPTVRPATSTRKVSHTSQDSPTVVVPKATRATLTAKVAVEERKPRNKTPTKPQKAASEDIVTHNNAKEPEASVEHTPAPQRSSASIEQRSEDTIAASASASASIKQLSTLGQSVMESMKRGIKRVLTEEHAQEAGEKKRRRRG
ncbi:hypothetical protein AUEXF2481DRAFT_409365 [Aureobasidium subglaciale EXF-2481]|uniref:Uncharacterized protein n=1 Tax=Aureobasidium subglaciale (strain EXF-2481) TaxID=1043005 RepID=A0A074YNI3_AURSE|nr:uncharacterized protein AUEXF2481DRAFT_409365 [Aureobasidium subglaciale EXF-2481]KAI5207603.1 hypothetical protein E4T38_03314 [Aureobasidium subglaciale]KAI5226440.1 hypothetical protein E4T40_03088 [Aureobasidium subglaciale]KAI5229963.1 hypothetical protein E4T41_03311 [Aureobasidium subglaciale]KAI5264427.1 hypothetical protein E4T46_03089 [Aureobasidium subglaciale]KEQ99255.1 hypothetical protein AUEXF2481DRAFT_409365 [Aureobasidium subglaciale EXF-2481]